MPPRNAFDDWIRWTPWINGRLAERARVLKLIHDLRAELENAIPGAYQDGASHALSRLAHLISQGGNAMSYTDADAQRQQENTPPAPPPPDPASKD
jgi:hypothetical protein